MIVNFIVGLCIGWWLGPAFSDITQKIIQEIKDWRIR